MNGGVTLCMESVTSPYTHNHSPTPANTHSSLKKTSPRGAQATPEHVLDPHGTNRQWRPCPVEDMDLTALKAKQAQSVDVTKPLIPQLGYDPDDVPLG